MNTDNIITVLLLVLIWNFMILGEVTKCDCMSCCLSILVNIWIISRNLIALLDISGVRRGSATSGTVD